MNSLTKSAIGFVMIIVNLSSALSGQLMAVKTENKFSTIFFIINQS